MKKFNELSPRVLKLLSLDPTSEINEEQLKKLAREKLSELNKSDNPQHLSDIVELSEIINDIVIF